MKLALTIIGTVICGIFMIIVFSLIRISRSEEDTKAVNNLLWIGEIGLAVLIIIIWAIYKL